MSEMTLHIGYTSTAAGDDKRAVLVLFYESFAQLLGTFAVALVVELHTAAGQLVGIVALQSNALEQAHHFQSATGGKLVDATGDENSYLIVLMVHVQQIKQSAKILLFCGLRKNIFSECEKMLFLQSENVF